MMVWNLFPELGHYCSTKDMRDQSSSVRKYAYIFDMFCAHIICMIYTLPQQLQYLRTLLSSLSCPLPRHC